MTMDRGFCCTVPSDEAAGCLTCGAPAGGEAGRLVCDAPSNEAAGCLVCGAPADSG